MPIFCRFRRSWFVWCTSIIFMTRLRIYLPSWLQRPNFVLQCKNGQTYTSRRANSVYKDIIRVVPCTSMRPKNSFCSFDVLTSLYQICINKISFFSMFYCSQCLLGINLGTWMFIPVHWDNLDETKVTTWSRAKTKSWSVEKRKYLMPLLIYDSGSGITSNGPRSLLDLLARNWPGICFNTSISDVNLTHRDSSWPQPYTVYGKICAAVQSRNLKSSKLWVS